jgi:lysophospholipase L1-like esterase
MNGRTGFILWFMISAAAVFWLRHSPLKAVISLEVLRSEQVPLAPQLFWADEDTNFDEQRSLHFAGRWGLHNYAVHVPSSSRRLRLDVLEGAGYFRVHRIEVRHLLGFPISSWSLGDPNGIVLRPQVTLSEKNGERLFESLGMDSGLELKFWETQSLWRLHLLNLLLGGFLGGIVLITTKKVFHREGKSAGPGSARPLSRRERVISIAVVLLAFVIGSAVLEMVYRGILSYQYSIRSSQGSSQWEILKGDPRAYQFPSSWRGSVQSVKLGDNNKFSFRLNIDGYRGADWDLEKDSERILFLGDSFTFGWGVQDQETYPFYFQRELNQSKKNTYVINAGIPGYGTAQELAVLSQLVGVLKPSVVIVGISANDGQPPADFAVSPQVTYQYATSWVISELREHFYRLFPLGRTFFAPSKFSARQNYHLDFEVGPGARSFRDSLKAMANICQESEASFWVSMIPDYMKHFDESYPYRPVHRKVMGIASELQVPAIDLLEHLQGLNTDGLRVPGDGHPNARAHQQIAKILADEFEKRRE